jgi:hypothetical protein
MLIRFTVMSDYRNVDLNVVKPSFESAEGESGDIVECAFLFAMVISSEHMRSCSIAMLYALFDLGLKCRVEVGRILAKKVFGHS